MASEQLRKDLLAEYFKVYDAVQEFDRRLITVKGWGVTLSLAAIGWGFEKGHYGLFLVAALSGLGFWAIEGVYKRYQMRSYVRMREIEVICFELFAETIPGKSSVSAPQIDWSWFNGDKYFLGDHTGPLGPPERFATTPRYNRTWLFAGVMFPHIISFAAGLALFCLALLGVVPVSNM
jgi:hypothetical protein